jgi:hypothetical protein
MTSMVTPLEILFATDSRGFSRINQRIEKIREDPCESVADSYYEARPANGSSAMFRACLMARDRRRWCGVQTPVRRRGTILPLSATNLRQQPDVFVVDGLNLLHAEFANLLAAKIFAPTFAATTWSAGTGRTALAITK